MRMKSTAVMGTLELVGKISNLEVKDGWLVMNLRTSTPAGWNLTTALSHSDLMDLVKLLCRPRNLAYMFFGFGKPASRERFPDL